MDEDFLDLVEEVRRISKRLDELNEGFFTKIFKGV
jgi:hypothetical protein